MGPILYLLYTAKLPMACFMVTFTDDVILSHDNPIRASNNNGVELGISLGKRFGVGLGWFWFGNEAAVMRLWMGRGRGRGYGWGWAEHGPGLGLGMGCG